MKIPSKPSVNNTPGDNRKSSLGLKVKRIYSFQNPDNTASIIFAKARDTNNRSLNLSYVIPMLMSDEPTRFTIKAGNETLSEKDFDSNSIREVKSAMFEHARNQIMASNNGERVIKTLHAKV
jgi:hypothetical protein